MWFHGERGILVLHMALMEKADSKERSVHQLAHLLFYFFLASHRTPCISMLSKRIIRVFTLLANYLITGLFSTLKQNVCPFYATLFREVLLKSVPVKSSFFWSAPKDNSLVRCQEVATYVWLHSVLSHWSPQKYSNYPKLKTAMSLLFRERKKKKCSSCCQYFVCLKIK